MSPKTLTEYDLIVIGGGPAGLFAAGFAAARGRRVLLLEKNPRCGAKLLITGKGRCNLTNSERDPRLFCQHFGPAGKNLLTALFAFGVDDTIAFFEQRGLALQEERGGRVFPAAGANAEQVVSVLEGFLAENGAEVRTSCPVDRLISEGRKVTSVETEQGSFAAANLVIATGGLAYPQTGSTGDGYGWAEACGHSLVPPQPALVALHLEEDWTGELLRLNLKNIQVTAVQDGQVVAERFGEAFFTRQGIGGPIILDMSAAVREALERGPVSLLLDFKPAVSRELFDQRLQRELAANNNRNFGNILGSLLPKALIPRFVQLAGIDPAKKCHSITRHDRLKLLQLFKGLELRVSGYGDFSTAIVTAGGISLRDLDLRSMRSKKMDNLYFAGEILDLAGPTGGFNLQLCWSTGYLAGVSAAAA